jgi:plastocyanin
MDGNFFFVIGGILVLAAVVISFIGIRGSEKFPPNRGVLLGVIALFIAIVGTTMAFAIVKSVDEQNKRNDELATQNQPAGEGGQQAGASETSPQPATPGGQPEASSGGNQQPVQTVSGSGSGGGGGGGASTTLNVTSPADGGLVFDPNGLTAKPGNVTITYDNPSPVPHSIAVATSNGNVLGEVQPFTQGKQSVDLSNLAPGKYVFYCTVPGHREAGMQGDLTVLGGPTP